MLELASPTLRIKSLEWSGWGKCRSIGTFVPLNGISGKLMNALVQVLKSCCQYLI